jgi:hypothetical protein
MSRSPSAASIGVVSAQSRVRIQAVVRVVFLVAVIGGLLEVARRGALTRRR